jgi:hypothetical protein
VEGGGEGGRPVAVLKKKRGTKGEKERKREREKDETEKGRGRGREGGRADG